MVRGTPGAVVVAVVVIPLVLPAVSCDVAEPVTGRLRSAARLSSPYCGVWVGDAVADPVARIEIEIRRGLEASAQCDQNALRHILLREPDGRGARAIHVHCHAGAVERLLDARVDSAGNVAHIVEHAFGQGAVLVEVGADDLDIDRCATVRSSGSASRCPPAGHRSHAGVFASQHVRSIST